jgi:hypothetical protein
MTRWILLAHRWCGIVLCVLVAAWCLSGIVMMYVPYPSFRGMERLATQEPLSLAGCCQLDAARAAAGDGAIDSFTIEMLAGRPVLRLDRGFGPSSAIDLIAGVAIEPLTPQQAQRVAASFARSSGATGSARLLGIIEFDQWTVSRFGADVPLYKYALDDAAGTQFYVSGAGGEVVQRTTAKARFWNYPGAVTHWLYPTALRQHVVAWSRVVIWTSLAGMFLVGTGLYVGWVRWKPRAARASPFHGVALWHHYAGLIFGLLALGWVGSGLVSMNPWGFLEGGSSSFERAQLAGMEISNAQAFSVVERLTELGVPAATRQIRSAPFAGRLFVMASSATVTLRLDAERLQPATIPMDGLQGAASLLQPDVAVASAGLIERGDHYYYAHKSAAPFPVFRVLLADAEATRYYIDPSDGSLLRKLDRNGRWWRWLFSALHQWDFSAGLRQRPVWDIVVVTLLLGLSTLSLTGIWLGARYLLRNADGRDGGRANDRDHAPRPRSARS